jgi:hypothetical protein
MLSILAVTTSVGRFPVQLVPGNHTGDCWYLPGLAYSLVRTAKPGKVSQKGQGGGLTLVKHAFLNSQPVFF